jgi:hypothetical protein
VSDDTVYGKAQCIFLILVNPDPEIEFAATHIRIFKYRLPKPRKNATEL